MKEVCFLYELKFSSGRSYFGITKDISERISGHEKAVFKKNSELPVHRAWRLHGKPSVNVLCCGEREFILELERKIIHSQNSRVPFGYNVSFGGETSPASTPEFRIAMSGANNPMKRPEVVKKRFADGHHMQSPDQRERARKQQIANNNMNSESARRKSSVSHTGKPSPRKGVFLTGKRMVICCETGSVFGSVREAAAWCVESGLSISSGSAQVQINKSARTGIKVFKLKWKIHKQRNENEI